jgi:hypothetical protein
MTSIIYRYRCSTSEVWLKVPASYPIEVPPKKLKNGRELASSLYSLSNVHDTYDLVANKEGNWLLIGPCIFLHVMALLYLLTWHLFRQQYIYIYCLETWHLYIYIYRWLLLLFRNWKWSRIDLFCDVLASLLLCYNTAAIGRVEAYPDNCRALATSLNHPRLHQWIDCFSVMQRFLNSNVWQCLWHK